MSDRLHVHCRDANSYPDSYPVFGHSLTIPERFVNRPPTPALLSIAAWINPPKLLVSGDVAQ